MRVITLCPNIFLAINFVDKQNSPLWTQKGLKLCVFQYLIDMASLDNMVNVTVSDERSLMLKGGMLRQHLNARLRL